MLVNRIPGYESWILQTNVFNLNSDNDISVSPSSDMKRLKAGYLPRADWLHCLDVGCQYGKLKRWRVKLAA
jgi:hypothetical protein